MTMDSILGLVRHLLTFGAGYLVANNVMADAEAQQAVAGAMALIAVGWSVYNKRNKESS